MLVRSAVPRISRCRSPASPTTSLPIDRFFVRSHVYAPRIDISQWRLTVAGDVTNPLTLTMDDLRRLPSAEIVSVLECAGNGRGFYEPSVPGLQWGHGAVGNGRWRGVRLADVLKRAGLKTSRRTSSSTAPTCHRHDARLRSDRFPSPRRFTRHAARLRDEWRDASDRARLPASRRRAGLGRRLVDQVGDVDLGARSRTRWVLDGSCLPASGKAGAAGHRHRSRVDATGDQPACEERHRRSDRRAQRQSSDGRSRFAARPGAAMQAR